MKAIKGVIAALALTAGIAQAGPICSIVTGVDVCDLTVVGNTATLNGALFEVLANGAHVGTGVIDPFLRLQNSPTEQGWNRDGTVDFDAKPGPWTHEIIVGPNGLPTVTVNGVQYVEIGVDANQDSAHPTIVLDELQLFESASAQPVTAYDTATGLLGGISPLYDLDAGAQANHVLIDYRNFNGSGLGLDALMLIPLASFQNTPGEHLYLYGRLGIDPPTGANTNDGFEEFMLIGATPTVCDGCQLPEPGSLALMGLGLGAAGLIVRRRPRW